MNTPLLEDGEARRTMNEEPDLERPGSDIVHTPWWSVISSLPAFWRSYNNQEDNIKDDTEDILVAAFTTERDYYQFTMNVAAGKGYRSGVCQRTCGQSRRAG
ncbi:uncharacterized protein LOC127754426 isoform X2 [Oryza glaberrima]|uniref:uncharacterized protein LOC127754426 isoform X2 n=1 Tax=Oryza glaberrima TaxID=4538 RepID=UPI00224C3E6B|nr:uncharacterized protein LOC127754426 isoform X2 [Oryza glaberrima]